MIIQLVEYLTFQPVQLSFILVLDEENIVDVVPDIVVSVDVILESICILIELNSVQTANIAIVFDVLIYVIFFLP